MPVPETPQPPVELTPEDKSAIFYSAFNEVQIHEEEYPSDNKSAPSPISNHWHLMRPPIRELNNALGLQLTENEIYGDKTNIYVQNKDGKDQIVIDIPKYSERFVINADLTYTKVDTAKVKITTHENLNALKDRLT